MFLCFTPVVTSHCRLVDIYYFIEWSRAPALPMKCYWTTLIFNANTQTRVDGCVEVTCLGQLGAWRTVRAFFSYLEFHFLATWQIVALISHSTFMCTTGRLSELLSFDRRDCCFPPPSHGLNTNRVTLPQLILLWQDLLSRRCDRHTKE